MLVFYFMFLMIMLYVLKVLLKDYWRYFSINLARLSVFEDLCCLQRTPEPAGGPEISS